jgi:hypothetical protein
VIFFIWFAIWYFIDVNSKADIGHQDISTLLCFVFLLQDGTSKPIPLIMAVNIKKVRRIDKIVLAPLIVFLGLWFELGNKCWPSAYCAVICSIDVVKLNV